MTKLIQQLNFSSSISNYFDVDVAGFEAKTYKYCGDGASLNASAAASKRSALSASDAECFSLCLGAGPLCNVIVTVDRTGGPDVPVADTAPPGGVTSGASSPATPSTPDHDDNRDLLCALLWSSGSSLCSSAESLAQDANPMLDHHHNQTILSKILEKKERRPVKVDFKIFLTENTNTRWEAVVAGNTMYLRVPSVLQSGSKDSFLRLLDFAEEKLGCTSCIICVLKSRSDRPTLIRTFMYMGFQVLPPNAPILPREIQNPDYIFLHYNME